MTIPLPGRDEIARWLATAPQRALLLLCFAGLGTLGAWVWSVADDLAAQRTVAAVAAEQAATAKAAASSIERQHGRLEDKLDHLIEAVADLRERIARRDREKNR